MKISKDVLVKRITLYRDGEQARVDAANAERQAKYEEDWAKYSKDLLPHFENLADALARPLSDGEVPNKEDIPKFFLENSWTYIFRGPTKPHPEDSGVEYYDALLAFLAAVADTTVSEVGMAKAGFHDIGRFFAEPDSPFGNKHRARSR